MWCEHIVLSVLLFLVLKNVLAFPSEAILVPVMVPKQPKYYVSQILGLNQPRLFFFGRVIWSKVYPSHPIWTKQSWPEAILAF